MIENYSRLLVKYLLSHSEIIDNYNSEARGGGQELWFLW